MLSLKTIILKYLLICVFLVSPCCVHRDNGYKNHDFFFFVLKPWLTFVREHGNSERILDALVVVKLFPTLKQVINLKTPKSFTGL